MIDFRVDAESSSIFKNSTPVFAEADLNLSLR
jgi:hypothetical protein